MKRGHALLISLLIGAAAIFGTFAATPLTLAARSRSSAAAGDLAARRSRRTTDALDRTEARLRRMLATAARGRDASAATPHRPAAG